MKGFIVGQGKHEQLLETNNIYQEYITHNKRVVMPPPFRGKGAKPKSIKRQRDC